MFESWNQEKQKIEFSKKVDNKLALVWDIWICKIWLNIWWEVSKNDKFQRPILVISNHLWADLVWIIPITTKFKENYKKFYFEINDFEKYWLDEKSYLILNQFKVISKKRLIKKLNNINKKWLYIPKVDKEKITEIKKLIKQVYRL